MKRIIALFTVILMFTLCTLTVFAAEAPIRLIDDADVLDSDEESTLIAKLDSISEKYDVDVAVVTVPSLDGETPEDFAEWCYDNAGYGEDGIMLLFSAEVVDGGRDYYVYYKGIGYDAADGNVESIKDAVVGYLKDDEFVEAFDTFADECEHYLDIEINGAPFNFGKSLIVSLVIGFIIAFIAVSVMKGKLKSVSFQRGAMNYQKAGSFKLTASKDIFLYRKVTRVAKPKNNTSGSGGGSRSGGSGGKC